MIFFVSKISTPFLATHAVNDFFIKALLRASKRYSSTTPYYKVPLQYYSVVHMYSSTTPVLHCTWKSYSTITLYYSSTTSLYYKYYSSTTRTTKYYSSTTQTTTPLQSTTLVLLRTTKFHSSISLYYKVLRQCYSVLQMY